MVRITDCPDMNLAVYHGCKETNQSFIYVVYRSSALINNHCDVIMIFPYFVKLCIKNKQPCDY